MEELRARYYRDLKRFITIPEVFRGLSDTSLFSALLTRAAVGFTTVYRKAESMFARLAKAVAYF